MNKDIYKKKTLVFLAEKGENIEVEVPWPSWLSDKMIELLTELDYSEPAQEIKNKFSGNKTWLSVPAVAVHDFIKGTERVLRHWANKENDVVQKDGLDMTPMEIEIGYRYEHLSNLMSEALSYFRSVWPEEYYILLD